MENVSNWYLKHLRFGPRKKINASPRLRNEVSDLFKVASRHFGRFFQYCSAQFWGGKTKTNKKEEEE